MQQPSLSREDLAELLVLVGKDSDRAAFHQLFRHFAPQIKSFALSCSAIAPQADELVQEVMVKVWRKASSFDPGKAAASTWIFTIARNTRIDMIRQAERIPPSVDADDVWLAADEGEPLVELHQKRTQQWINDGLSQLAVEQNQVLSKAYMEGKSHSEIANELGLPLGTVKGRIRLAMQKMKLLLGS